MAIIHPLATVHPGAKLAGSVEVGPYAYIDDNVEIGEGTKILPHATIFETPNFGWVFFYSSYSLFCSKKPPIRTALMMHNQ